ncbi:DegT/DnrJ/EryC1/StrS aminotransferase family protein [Methylacidimicrobium sp. B4]|uniref:DegT/DnrJ/EryC1/StrS family aminotransferase n=1 Tax=Methylacidimicrobium sp. B4 TaxID=2796139 RepID=UPI001A8D547F|nr:DegT/DnrJ/EryC1/StrS aminotransferase family protein [Methylacidimicrobium sp. B4]QSR85195.1 DegT/DnrJ/EryC1/StrS aminotransferase family protein [Methylacidimicrobium sp. B4]
MRAGPSPRAPLPRIPLSDPDLSEEELAAVDSVLRSPEISAGALVDEWENAFAAWVGRKHAVAVGSGAIGLCLGLRALGIGVGDRVILSGYSWHQVGEAVALCGAEPRFVDIDYWSGAIAPERAAEAAREGARAILAGNTLGHPASWRELERLAEEQGLLLLEDATESIGSRYGDRMTGRFGRLAVFDFSQPGALVCGEGGMVVTDDEELAAGVRYGRSRSREERFSGIATMMPSLHAGPSNLTAALGLVQLRRIGGILERRRLVEAWYFQQMKSFEGIKDPYIAPEAGEVHWFLYPVHLGTRFTRSSRDAILEDLAQAEIEASAYCQPMHLQGYAIENGWRKGRLPVTEKVADRSIVLPFHAHLTEEQIAFIVKTLKDSSVNVGAGAAIYL